MSRPILTFDIGRMDEGSELSKKGWRKIRGDIYGSKFHDLNAVSANKSSNSNEANKACLQRSARISHYKKIAIFYSD